MLKDRTILKEYSYELPRELIATKPADPRDSARLFVYDTKADTVSFDTFHNLPNYIPQESLLIFNDTKVLPARISLEKEAGGKVELLFLLNEHLPHPNVRAFSDRKLSLGQILFLDGHQILSVKDQDKSIFTFDILIRTDEFSKMLYEKGQTPIPKYIESDLSEGELRQRYQSIFASKPASIAAPTASLHFTPELIGRIKEKTNVAYLTLHVGRGTFAPVTEENLSSRTLHHEEYDVPRETAEAICVQKNKSRPIIAVGTTATRALESSQQAILGGKSSSGSTDIFIQEPYEFKIIDGLITNFHLPQSSLMCLVDAFLGHKKSKRNILDLYKIAIEEKFRFYSFGDGMLIL